MLSPRTKASKAKAYSQGIIAEIMKDLDRKKMQMVRKDFDRIGDGEVSLKEFVEIMTKHLPTLDKNNLCELFLEIDVNGDGTMEWDELTAFFVEKSSVYDESKQDDFVVPYKYAGKQENRALFDENYIQKLTYVPPLEAVVVLRNHSKTLQLYDARDFSSELCRLSGGKGIPICCEYVPSPIQRETRIQPGTLVTANSNLTMTRWELAMGETQFSVQSSWPTPHAQASLCWIEKYKTLYSASVAGIIHLWDIDKRREKSCIMNAHDDIASCLTELQGLDCIASGGMDSEVYIWDIECCAKRQALHGHESGVYTMVYNTSHKLLVTGGIDHDAIVWSPFSPNIVYKLKGHKESIVEMQNIPGSEHQFVSGDLSGTFKVWDIRKYGCVQTFTDDPPYHLQKMTSFVIANGYDMQKEKVEFSPQSASAAAKCNNKAPYVTRIAAATKMIHLFDQCDPVIDMVTDDIPVIGALINTVSMTVITSTGKTVKIWDILTGKQLRKYDNLTTSDITTFCMDDRQRKLILGDHSGKIKVFNYANGAFMKAFDPHHAEVSQLVYCNGNKNVVSVSWDRDIVVHSELEPTRGVVLRKMDRNLTHKSDITCADYSSHLVLTGSLDKSVHLWDFFSGKLYAKLYCQSDITAVSFINGSSGFAAADHSGQIHFWLHDVEEKEYEKSHVSIANYRQCPHRKPEEKSSILAIKWEPDSGRLIAGDEYGSLRCWSISKDLKDIQEVWVHANLHEDGITSVDAVERYGLVVTASFDCCVRGCSLEDGTVYGVLVNGAGRGTNRSHFWDVPFSEELLQKELRASLRYYDECEQTSSPPRQEQKVAASVVKTARSRRESKVDVDFDEKEAEAEHLGESKEPSKENSRRKLLYDSLSLPF